MKAIILAAGIASRLRPLTDHIPKCLLKVGEKSLLERTFDALIQNGVSDFAVVTGYKQRQIVDFLTSNYSEQTIKLIYNDKYETTNNVYSLWLACPYVQKEEVLLLDSDIIFDPQIVGALLQSPKQNALALNKHELGDEEIKVIADSDGKVLEISKTCSPTEAIGESIGIEKIAPGYFEALTNELERMIVEEKQDNVFYEKAFERLIAQDHFFYAIDTTAFFSAELDTAKDFEHAQKLIPPHLH
ncbi:MAG: phosphocholine cytidylyltransferase family protein [Prevotellaceae bacterium]|jgi:choline kinase|nr:phosphocholine cytidylyltransferase family protein [Prevotellaceae bacterium]